MILHAKNSGFPGAAAQGISPDPPAHKAEEEGGCGVTGFACSIPVGGKHIFEPSRQMHNRGNGKGGGIAAVGLCRKTWGFPGKSWTAITCFRSPFSIPACARAGGEGVSSFRIFDVDRAGKSRPSATTGTSRSGESAPGCHALFCAGEKGVLSDFVDQQRLEECAGAGRRRIHLPERFQAQPPLLCLAGGQEGLCHVPRQNMMILKIVGYAEQVASITSWKTSRPTSGSPTSAIPPRAGSGTRAARIPSSG